MKRRVRCGLDRIDTADRLLNSGRIGLMTAPCGIDLNLNSAVDIVMGRYKLSALFACEHGIRGDVQAGVEVPTHRDPQTGVPVFSLYGQTRRLTEEMLDTFDIFLYDLQCVGVRHWTFLYSLAYAMEDCAKAGKPLVVLDRLNPIGAEKVCGTVIKPAFQSFVGGYGLATRHGLTVGEYALYVRDFLRLDLDLTVVPLAGYERHLYLDDTDSPWAAPSPNCATLHAALCYPGTCVFEGSNVSEGRGTTLPFELIGAPWIDGRELEARMARRHLPGLHFRRASFVPAFSKHRGEVCHGVQMHITGRGEAQEVLGALVLMDEIRALAPDRFQFLSDGSGNCFIDRLLGTDEYRLGLSGPELIEKHLPEVKAFRERSQAFHLYQ